MNGAGLVLTLVAAALLAACGPSPQRQATANTKPPVAAAPAASSPWAVQEYEKDGRMPRRYSVVAYGYNYTDLYIDSFEVDGAGGGNLEVSVPTAGGGKHTCCTTLVSGLPEGTEFVIKWTRDRRRWCEQTVKLTKPIPTEPRYLEVHFYPDGKIEIEASQQSSPPRLKLERANYAERKEIGNVNNDEKYSRCKDGYP
jgi:Protein of unknown function (DUF3304)